MARRVLALLAMAAALVIVTGASGGGLRSSGSISAWPKISHLPGGSTVEVWANGRVIERDREGRVSSDSIFQSYVTYKRWVRFMASFQAAVKAGDRSKVASFIEYPLSRSDGKIRNRQGLLRHFETVFTRAVVAEIERADPRALFCQNVSEVMLGSGVVWGDNFSGHLAVITVNFSGP